MQLHIKKFGGSCLDCHDGTGDLANFNHDLVFPLTGKHTQANCTDCHTTQNSFTGLSQECSTCHLEPQIHAGFFGLQCQSCHTTDAWQPAQLLQHGFPLSHGNEEESSTCQTCHPANYTTYTCYNCHAHNQAGIEKEHREEGISQFANCMECHADGKEHDD